MKNRILITLLLLISTSAGAQNYNWTRTFGGSTSDDVQGMCTDAAGNVYMAGYYFGPVDFDPGPGSAILPYNGINDAFVVKYDDSGNLLWARCIGNAGNDFARSVAVDGSGNVYVMGEFSDTLDLDPGAGTDWAIPVGTNDFYLVKLDGSGNYLWGHSFGSTGYDEPWGMACDAAGNVAITGSFADTLDFDPGVGTDTQVPVGGSDAFVVVLDASGIFAWVRTMGGGSGDTGKDVFIDGSGNVYVTGSFYSIAQFGGVSLSSNGSADIFIVKYTGAGNVAWAKGMGGTSADAGNRIITSASGDVYSVGFFRGTMDFDPGAGTASATSAGNLDIYIQKLNASGDFQWVKTIGGSGFDEPYDIEMDNFDNLYISGRYNDTVDFDPGPGTENHIANNGDFYFQKLDGSGNHVWTYTAGGSVSYDHAKEIEVTSAGMIYVAGSFGDAVDFDPTAGTDVHTTNGSQDGFLLRMSECVPTTYTDVQTACESYLWMDGNTYTGNNNTATFTLTNAGGCDSIITLNLTVYSIDSGLSVSGSTLTAVHGGGSYQWIDCGNGNAPVSGATGQSFTPTVSGSYACIVTEGPCSDTSRCETVTLVGLTSGLDASVALYPNPVSDELIVTCGGILEKVVIYDLSGRMLRESADSRVSTAALPAGMYLVRVFTAKGQVTRRIVKQ